MLFPFNNRNNNETTWTRASFNPSKHTTYCGYRNTWARITKPHSPTYCYDAYNHTLLPWITPAAWCQCQREHSKLQMWCCVVWWVALDVSNDRNTFTFTIKNSTKKNCHPPKRRKLLTQRHSALFYKTWRKTAPSKRRKTVNKWHYVTSQKTGLLHTL